MLQAIRKLAENAITHTPEGTTVEIKVSEDGTVRVIDEGPGVPEGERDLIFRRFWRRDRRRPGCAGLSIVSRVMDAHGGSIAVGNQPGGGDVFSLSFPLASRARNSPHHAAAQT